MKYDLAIVVPIYNESKRIISTVFKLNTFLKIQPYRTQIILVDDGSNDDTVKIAQNLINKDLLLLQNIVNQGKGAAVKKGMIEANAEYVMFIDADLPVTLDNIDKAIKTIKKNKADMVIGTRYSNNSGLFYPLRRCLFGKLLNFIVRKLLFNDISDTQCGFKLFTKKAASSIFPRLTVPRFSFDLQIFHLAKNVYNFKIVEQAVKYNSYEASSVSIVRDGFEILGTVLKLKFKNNRDNLCLSLL